MLVTQHPYNQNHALRYLTSKKSDSTARSYQVFGVTLKGRNFTLAGAEKSRMGFQGQEMDDEIKGEGNSYTTEFRQYDPRLGRWLSLDPLTKDFPGQSPYCAYDNNPIYFIDPKGAASEGTGDDTKVDKGAGGSTLVLPERAKIISRLKDYKGDGKIDYNGTTFEAKDGDVKDFSVDGDKYSVSWNNDGSYKGYYNNKGERWNNPEKEIVSKEAGYIPPPKSLPGFPDATKVKNKGGRPRWVNDDGDILEWDRQHGDVERYNKQGNKHKGSYDPETGKKTKEPVPGRKTAKPMLDNPTAHDVQKSIPAPKFDPDAAKKGTVVAGVGATILFIIYLFSPVG